MRVMGRLFPRENRAPWIEPVAEASLRKGLTGLSSWTAGRTQRIASGFYTSQAMEIRRIAQKPADGGRA
jgi:magnesium-protoporphyrin O-methyltransferase